MDSLNVELFGCDPKVQKALVTARNVSVTKVPVLVVGERGVGKKTLGRFIHESSSRADGAITTIDCSTDAQNVENQILGYRDAETGRFHKGALEASNGGSVILSNVDALDESFQKRLHQILMELDDYDLDVRIIATTTKNLSKLVGSGSFYRGLYTYISANSIFIPPLRERVSDLEMIARNFVREMSSTEDSFAIDEAAMNKILAHNWTHNVQELKTVLENSLTNLDGSVLKEEELELGEKRAVSMMADDDNEGIRLMSLKEAEKLLIKKALVHTSENRTQAAKILGVSIRTLRNKINEYRSTGSTYFVNLR